MYICDRFHCLPDEALRQGSEIIRLLEIERLGTRQEREEVSELG